MASALADELGVSVRILAEAFRALGRQGAEAVGETAKGLRRAIQALFGGPKEK